MNTRPDSKSADDAKARGTLSPSRLGASLCRQGLALTGSAYPE